MIRRPEVKEMKPDAAMEAAANNIRGMSLAEVKDVAAVLGHEIAQHTKARESLNSKLVELELQLVAMESDILLGKAPVHVTKKLKGDVDKHLELLQNEDYTLGRKRWIWDVAQEVMTQRERDLFAEARRNAMHTYQPADDVETAFLAARKAFVHAVMTYHRVHGGDPRSTNPALFFTNFVDSGQLGQMVTEVMGKLVDDEVGRLRETEKYGKAS